jgi:hypothetical protein
MKSIALILSGLAALLLPGCDTADQKIPEIAADYCNCLAEMGNNMSSKTKIILEKVANAADPENTTKNELEKLRTEDQIKVSTEIITLGNMNDTNSKVGRCLQVIEEKYGEARTITMKKFREKLVKELKSKTGCEFAATLMKIETKLGDPK